MVKVVKKNSYLRSKKKNLIKGEKTMVSRKGFTLVEILIVVVILGILAAIIIPQFSNASSEAKLNTLRTNLQTIRCQLQLFKVQSTTDTYPTLAGFAGAMIPTYLQSVPNNPFTDTNDIAATAGSAWQYDEATGNFKAGDAAHADW
jgi:general secretion pathway protein G